MKVDCLTASTGWCFFFLYTTPLKNMTSSIGMRTETQYQWEHSKNGNQTTNQYVTFMEVTLQTPMNRFWNHDFQAVKSQCRNPSSVKNILNFHQKRVGCLTSTNWIHLSKSIYLFGSTKSTPFFPDVTGPVAPPWTVHIRRAKTFAEISERASAKRGRPGHSLGSKRTGYNEASRFEMRDTMDISWD